MLHVHRAERADGLVEALRALLAEPLADPFAPEVVAVPSRGVERWLAQRLSARLGASPGRLDGICANVAFPFPHRLVEDAVAAASGLAPEEDPWRPERAVWPLLAEVDASLGEPWLRGLAVHLGRTAGEPDEVRRGRRFGSVRHLSELFDRYALHRPAMVRAWAGGDDVDDAGAALAEDVAWQAELWRRLRQRIGHPGPAERLAPACERLRAEPALADLPPRLALFGLTRLPPARLEVLRALAAARDVHLLALHPSPALWDAIDARPGRAVPVARRDADLTADLAEHRLLASWGQDARELQLVLSAGEATAHHHPVEHRGGTLLARIQAGVRANAAPAGAPAPGGQDRRPALAPGDDSLRVHACHGRARQVEVVREAILHALRDDPALEPRDVIVMCPDIEAFAPLIHATFAAGEPVAGDEPQAAGGPVALNVRLADRALRQTNPVLGVVAQLIDLASERITASQLLDLAAREPVRRRFRLDDDDLARLQDWVAGSGIRWGLDAAHRAPFKLDGLAAGTWRAGLDRMLLGVTMTEDGQRLFAGVLPLDDVDSGAIDLAGRLAELVERVDAALGALAAPKPVGAWADALSAAADALTATSDRDAWQRRELQRLLDEVVDEASAGGAGQLAIALPEVRALLAGRLEGRPTRASFRTGHLTMCTLVPMRSVPHRMVCLLGLDDGVFPRRGPRDGDDLMAGAPHVGDRDARIEDRQLLLDALLAAEDRLVITYSGNDERTNAVRPPAVPVGELLDVVDATVRVEDGGRAREHVLVRHPLQPFDPRNFEAGRLVPGRRWSFDARALDGARALTAPRVARAPFLSAPLPPAPARLVEVEDLVRFAQHPVRAFLRQRLGISVADFAEEVEDDLPVELDGLGRWGVGQRLVEARLAGVDGRTAVLAEIARGTLPPGVLGKPVVDELWPVVEGIVRAAEALAPDAGSPGSVDVRAFVGDRAVTGTVPGVAGDLVRAVTYSRLAPRHRVAAWVRLLALTAARPERAFAAATIGSAAAGRGVEIARIGPLGADAAERRAGALAHLAVLLDLHDRGMREPLPLYCRTSSAYAQAVAAGADPVRAARGAWASAWNFDKEDREPEHRLAFGDARTLEQVLEEPPRPDETGEGWAAEETTRLGRLARRMWDGMLRAETIEAAGS